MTKPLVLCVAGLKGGTGKTTTAVLLAAHWHRKGRRVAVLDADPQRSATHWRAASATAEEDASANLPTVASVEAPAIGPTVRDLVRAYDIIVIDTPARLATETRRGLLAAGDFGGFALCPMGPSGVDLRATVQTAELVTEAQDFRPALGAGILRNRWAGRLRIAGDVDEAMSGLGLPILGGMLSHRTAYAEAVTHGLALEDVRDTKALAELAAVALELESMAKRKVA